MRTYKSNERMAAAQQRYAEILEQVTIETDRLVSDFLNLMGTPFDFQSLYFRITDNFDYSSSRGICMRRDLRNMEALGMLKRGKMMARIRGVSNQEYDRVVDTFHIPALFERDVKFMAALPSIQKIKRQKTDKTPTKIMTTMFGDFEVNDSNWLERPLIDWLDGKNEHIVLPDWCGSTVLIGSPE